MLCDYWNVEIVGEDCVLLLLCIVLCDGGMWMIIDYGVLLLDLNVDVMVVVGVW